MNSDEIVRMIIKKIDEKGIEQGPIVFLQHVLGPLFEKLEQQEQKLNEQEELFEYSYFFKKCSECDNWVNTDKFVGCHNCPFLLKCEKHARKLSIFYDKKSSFTYYLCDEHFQSKE